MDHQYSEMDGMIVYSHNVKKSDHVFSSKTVKFVILNSGHHHNSNLLLQFQYLLLLLLLLSKLIQYSLKDAYVVMNLIILMMKELNVFNIAMVVMVINTQYLMVDVQNAGCALKVVWKLLQVNSKQILGTSSLVHAHVLKVKSGETLKIMRIYMMRDTIKKMTEEEEVVVNLINANLERLTYSRVVSQCLMSVKKFNKIYALKTS